MAIVNIKISPYVAYIMSGSDISDPNSGSGYDPLIGHEYRRTQGTKGGVYQLTPRALRDLAEFCDALSSAESQGGNPAGAASLAKLQERCLEHADRLDSEGGTSQGRIDVVKSPGMQSTTTKESPVQTDAERAQSHNSKLADALATAKIGGRGFVACTAHGAKVHAATGVIKGHSGFNHPRPLCMNATPRSFAGLTGDCQTDEVTCQRCLASPKMSRVNTRPVEQHRVPADLVRMLTINPQQEESTMTAVETPDTAAAEKAAKAEAAAKAKADKKAAAAKAKADKAAKAKKEREQKAAKAKAEKDAKAAERAARPKKVSLTLSQRRQLLALAAAGAKGLAPKGQQAVKPFEYFKSNGLASTKTVKGDTVYVATAEGKARAKDVNPKYAA